MKPAPYTRTAIVLHALTALLIFAAFPLGWVAIRIALSPLQLRLYSYHKWAGVTVAALLVLRLAWRAVVPPPPLPPTVPAWEVAAAKAGHLLLYLLMAAVPVSGWLMSSALGFTTVYLGRWPLPDLVGRDQALGELLVAVHRVLNYALLAAVVLHIAAALKHHFVDHDGILVRMFRFGSGSR